MERELERSQTPEQLPESDLNFNSGRQNYNKLKSYELSQGDLLNSCNQENFYAICRVFLETQTFLAVTDKDFSNLQNRRRGGGGGGKRWV